MNNLTKNQKAKCNAIIHVASLAAAGIGAGLAQAPLTDNAIITPIQLTMAISLGQVFGIDLSQSSAKAAIGSAGASMVGKTAVNLILGWVPVLGNAVNAGTAATVTEALGWTLVNDFARQAKVLKGVA